MNKKEMAQILAILKAAYPNTKNIDDANATLNAYYLALGDYSASSVMKAARLHMETGKFFPAPSELRDKMVRAEMVYSDTEIGCNCLGEGKKEMIPLEAGKTTEERLEAIENKLEELCKFVGLGYPNEIED